MSRCRIPRELRGSESDAMLHMRAHRSSHAPFMLRRSLASVELAPRDPDPRRHRSLQCRPEPEQSQPRRRRLHRRRYGKVPLLECVQPRRAAAGRQRRAAQLSADRRHRGLRPAPCRTLLFGADSDARRRRAASSPCRRSAAPAALKIGADFLRRFAPGAQVWISDPSWENHRALFEGAGSRVNTYPYYDARDARPRLSMR